MDKVCENPPIGRAGSCNAPGDVCEDGLTCLGVEGNMKCFVGRDVGDRCGRDPFWACRPELRCVDKICAGPPIAKAGACNNPGDICEDGVSCLGPEGNKKCVRGRNVGDRCGNDPFWFCKEGLKCVKKVCLKPIAKAGACNIPAPVCEAGLSCLGPVGNRKCVRGRNVGDMCGNDPFWFCKNGLDCVDKVCTAPGGTA